MRCLRKALRWLGSPHTIVMVHRVYAFSGCAIWMAWLAALSRGPYDYTCVGTMSLCGSFELGKMPVVFFMQRQADRETGARLNKVFCWLFFQVSATTLAYYLFVFWKRPFWEVPKDVPLVGMVTPRSESFQIGCEGIIVSSIVLSALGVVSLLWHLLSQGLVDTSLLDMFESPMLQDHSTCAICLSDFQGGDCVRRLVCGHWFHRDCADKWFVVSCSCPFRCILPPWWELEGPRNVFDDPVGSERLVLQRTR